tara:strand:+ start:822 stop:2222 length:1401 start_codon:yes stop_codon:yes gene_type:complete
MSSPTNLIQYLFGTDAAGGDRGSVRDELEKRKRALIRESKPRLDAANQYEVQDGTIEAERLNQRRLQAALAAKDAERKAQYDTLYGEGSLENVIDKRQQKEARAKEFTSAMGVDRSNLPLQFTDDKQMGVWGNTYDQQSQRQREAMAQARHKAQMAAMQGMGSGQANEGYIPPQVAPRRGLSYGEIPYLTKTYGQPVGQLPDDGPPSYPALKLGADIAKQKNEEGKETNFIDTLLGDIDFKALAQNPIFQQVMGGLQRMPFNQGRFGDSMLTGFTRGVQQYDVAKSQEDAAQAAIDLEQERYNTEQERYDAQQATASAASAESLRRWEADKRLQRERLAVTKGQNYINQNKISSKLDFENYKATLAKLIREDSTVKDIINNQTGGWYGPDDEDIIKQTMGEAVDIYNSRLGTNIQVDKKQAFVLALETVSRAGRGGISPASSQEDSDKDTVAKAIRLDGKPLVKSK